MFTQMAYRILPIVLSAFYFFGLYYPENTFGRNTSAKYVFLSHTMRFDDPFCMIPFVSSEEDWNNDWDEEWNDIWTEDAGSRISPQFRYNRVEGLYTGARLRKEYWVRKYPNRPFLYGFTGYGFAAKMFQYRIGLEKGFFDNYRLAFGGEYHDMIDTPDRWIIPDTENSLAALLLKEDFHDFYSREGGSGYIVQNFTRTLILSIGYHYDKFDSLKRNAQWSLFGKGKRFPDNPRMDAGKMRSIVTKIVFDSRNSIKRTTRGWHIQFEWEHTGSAMKSDFDFNRLLLDLRRYQPLGYSDGLNFRIRMGVAKGTLPWQRSFHLGGLSTLRGFPYKALPAGRQFPGGNRMILAQVEYRLGRQDLPDAVDFGILEHFNLILFADVGWIGYEDAKSGYWKGFDKLSWSSYKSDIGIALANRSGNLRFEIARRTDTDHKPYVFLFRINRPF